MNLFRTEVFPDQSDIKIDFGTPVLLLGSCFVQNIGEKLDEYCFPVFINPFGVLYNSVTISQSIEILLSKKEYTEKDLGFRNGLWYSFDHYTRFSHHDKKVCLAKINNKLMEAREFLKTAKTLIITLGTSWAFRYKKTGKTVANCHKIPANEFDRYFIDNNQITNDLIRALHLIKLQNPELSAIFTVSPIRHWKDGAAGNQLSKSNLIVAIHNLIKSENDTNYFPSYEIMMDDLRDYRFYEEDMIHPIKMAVEYIWQKFLHTHIDGKCIPVMNELEKLNKALNHRPFNPMSKDYIKFITQNIQKAEGLGKDAGIDTQKIVHGLKNCIK